VNQFQQPVTHAWALYPNFAFGHHPGESTLVCRFPNLKLNVGRYSLRTYLTEPPGGALYEQLDAICPFEIVRLDQSISGWGYRPESCVYYEEFCWDLIEAGLESHATTA